jgi:AraC-like DNA-binding protein
MRLKRLPRPALRPFVEALWVADESGEPACVAARREHVLPTGQIHVVLRLADDPLRLFDDATDQSGRLISEVVVGGARSSFYIREVSRPLCSVGAQLRPGAAQALFGVPADELSERHTPLDDLWGPAAASIRTHLAELRSPAQRVDVFEAMLAARLPKARGLHPAVAHALELFPATTNVRDVVKRSGFSHRTFISLFRGSVGLTPKLYCRVLRFQRALRCVSASQPTSWIDVAMEAGYSDQAHFNRQFREFAGVTPTAYRHASPRFPHHLETSGDRR